MVVDSLNYIKGWRYQMYCIAREMKARYCVVFCNTSLAVCGEYNKESKSGFRPEV